MKHKTYACIAVGIMCLFLSKSWAADAVLSVDDGYPPFMFSDTEEAKGIYPEILNALFEDMGKTVEVQSVPWPRVMQSVEDNTAGAAGVYKNDERLKKYDYSDVLYTEKIVLYVKQDSLLEIEKFEDLDGLMIGLLSGWSYGDKIDRARKSGLFQTEEVRSDELNLRKLMRGRIDAMLGVPESVSPTLKKMRIDHIVEIRGPAIVNNGAYIVFNKNDRKLALLEEINLILEKFHNEGVIESIVDNYILREAQNIIAQVQ